MSSTDRLIVFTRYPQPGQAKTRLIPALGAEGAANFQRQMTEHTLRQVQILQSAGISVEIWFASTQSDSQSNGIDRSLMQDWLSSTWVYQAQQGEDLGERLIHAIQAAFDAGMQRVVTIGTDCPDLDAARMQQAFEQLQQADVVLGPATDGGYYLIGLKQPIPQLFTGITWGSASVLQQTIAITEQLGLTVALLDALTDIDRPEDLAVWEAMQQSQKRPRISVVIPVLNEEASIEAVLTALQKFDVEVIVVDGGSGDRTLERAKAIGVNVLQSAAGRAMQMNAGAAVAQGEILLFLHADTQLPDRFVELVQQTLNQPNVIAGAFDLKIAGQQPGLRWIEQGVKWRSRWLQMPYGDQALFLRAKTFQQLGGFAELPIMEDFELVQRLKKLGMIAIAPAEVITSGRRWQRLGVLRTTVINQLVILAYWFKISPRYLTKLYHGVKKK